MVITLGGRAWIATGREDLRKGIQGLPLLVQEQPKRGPHAGVLGWTPRMKS